ncbi:signal recognition particle-docking protein FtsY [Amycolatopsis sulphurea]|uniref:Signal recognition particle receptor FtsY n=1 Tax=Amycolatopsis sulphurea TaxID=76022 RepID=A0A2A9F7B8_9PSEU|nr:signal recognition particle-docking protein FtsY [Amycolatopsis sulphurea]PFG46716.1 signal recognition particle-docking protein FtsY [Amycolatopsis sulphurea]
MSSTWFWIVIAAVVVLVAVLVSGLLIARRRRISIAEPREVEQKPKGGGYAASGGITFAPGGEARPNPGEAHPVVDRPEVDGQPGVGDDAAVPRDSDQRSVRDVALPEPEAAAEAEAEAPAKPATSAKPAASAKPATPAEPATPTKPAEPAAPAEPAKPTKPAEPATPAAPVTSAKPATPAAPDSASAPAPPAEPVAEPASEPADEIDPATGRLERLRGRLSKSRSMFGQSLLGLLGGGDLDEDSWQDVEDTLLLADLGAATTTQIVERLRDELGRRAVRSSDEAREVLREVLTAALSTDSERSVRALPHEVDGKKQPAVVLVAGVNGTGKTTTTGKLARVLVAQGATVVLGAADTFRAAAADQLQTWGERAGASVVRGKEGADPAAVAFDAVKQGITESVDAVLVDTAGRLHTKTGLMDELGKVKRVVEKQAKVDEVLLVLDATTGQNGLAQARVFAEVIDVTGIVLTKLDGTAKGGIVFQVQRELGVPVKLVGLGEGPDDLAPFEPGAFVDALLG